MTWGMGVKFGARAKLKGRLHVRECLNAKVKMAQELFGLCLGVWYRREKRECAAHWNVFEKPANSREPPTPGINFTSVLDGKTMRVWLRSRGKTEEMLDSEKSRRKQQEGHG